MITLSTNKNAAMMVTYRAYILQKYSIFNDAPAIVILGLWLGGYFYNILRLEGNVPDEKLMSTLSG